jgi:tetratricopeptide (TPR) repeat protein
LGADQPAPLFEARLQTATAGNPLFVLETLRYLYGEGLLWRDQDGIWNTPFDETTTDYAELPLSPVIERIIAHRLTQLSSELRQVLNAAAVLDARFEPSTLAAITELDTAMVLAALDDLAQRSFIDGNEQEYQFHHDKLRLVTYDSLSEEERVHLHRRAFQVIEDTQPKQTEILAHHCTSGQLWNKAVHYHRVAAEAAQAAHTYAAAARHLDSAIRSLDRADMEEERYGLLAMREAVLDILGEREAQVADLETMLTLSSDNDLQRAHVLCRQAELLANLGRHEEAEMTARQALAIAEHSGCETSQVAALIALDLVICAQRQPGRAISCLHQAANICWKKVDLPQQARAHHVMARSLIEHQFSEAQTKAQTALALYERLEDQCGQVNVLVTLGVLSMKQSDSQKAIAHCSQALQIARRTGYRIGEAAALANLGEAFYFENQFAQALETCLDAQLIFHILGHFRYECAMRELAATIHYSILGDFDTAWDDLQATVELSKKRDIPCSDQLKNLGNIARCRGEHEIAYNFLEQHLNDALHAGENWSAIEAYKSLVRLELDKNRPDIAMDYLKAAEKLCREVGISNWDINLLELRGLVLLALDQPQAALKATSRAMAQLKTGIKQAYLIPFCYFQTLSALGRTQEAHAALEQAHKMLSECLSDFTPEQQKRSWENVPEHHAILAAWTAIHPSPITVHLPRADAPIGRPLHDDEWVEVHWSAAEPEDAAIPGKVARRHKRILRLLHQAEEQGAAPTIDDLAAALDVGKATIKRDLTALRRSGHSIDTRGSKQSQQKAYKLIGH